VKRLLALTLLAAALFGLIGQGAAFAMAGSIRATGQPSEATASMSADCAEMMGLAKEQPPQPDKPCKGMTPECVAKMGCAVPVALTPPLTLDPLPQDRAAVPLQSPIAALVGRETGPDPHPPAHLG
jgi:hypothetical protein